MKVMNYSNENQGRSKEQVKVNEQVGAIAMLLFVVSTFLFVIINALANG